MKTFKRYGRFFPVALLWFALAGVPLQADDRQEPIDVIIALDKSLSMEEAIAPVRDYVNEAIVDRLLIPGDFFLLITFYGRAEVHVARTIESVEDKREVKAAVSGIRADGRFTDIGNALDVLGREVAGSPNPGRRKHLLLITDGLQEAPPSSRYYTPDGSFNHEFLSNTKIIQQQGWKIHVLGIGTQHEARQLAQELSGTYTTIEESGSAEQLSGQLTDQTRGFLGRTDLDRPPRLSRLSSDGRAALTLSLTSRDYAEEVRITIEQVRLTLPGRAWNSILAQGPFTLEMPAEGSRTFKIPVQLSAPPDRGAYSGSVEFLFSAGESFIPSVTEVDFAVQSVFERNLHWGIPGLLALLGLITLAIILLARRTRNPRVRFKITIEGQPIGTGRDVFALREGKGLFVNEASDAITLTESRSAKSLARVFVSGHRLRLNVLKQDRFPKLREVPADIRGEAFRIRANSGKDLSVRFVRLEQDG